MTRRFRSLLGTRDGSTAIEFAIIAPVFFFLVFGIIEVGLGCWYASLVRDGAEKGGDYLRAQRLSGALPTEAGLRDAICQSVALGGLACDPARLKIGTYAADVPDANGGFGVPRIIENLADPNQYKKSEYIVAVGYYWELSFSTSKLLFPQGPNGSQIQARTSAVLSERVWDDGISR